MRGAAEAIWIFASLLGLVYAMKGVGASHADFAAASKLKQRETVEFLFASSVYRSQLFRVTKLVLFVFAGVFSSVVHSEYEWRPIVLIIVLTAITVITATDAFMHEQSRKRIKRAFEKLNGNVNDRSEQARTRKNDYP